MRLECQRVTAANCGKWIFVMDVERRWHGAARPRLDRRGFSLVELLIGIALFTIILTGLGSSGIYASKIRTDSRVRLEAAHFTQGELEYLLSQPYDSLTSGSRSSESGKSEWVVEDSFAYLKILLRITYAPTEGVSVEDSIVTFRMSP